MSVPIKIRPCPEGNRVEVGVNFVTSRVKTSIVRIVNEDYAPMFPEGENDAR